MSQTSVEQTTTTSDVMTGTIRHRWMQIPESCLDRLRAPKILWIGSKPSSRSIHSFGDRPHGRSPPFFQLNLTFIHSLIPCYNKIMTPITIQTTVSAPIEKVWDSWTLPEHITQWAFASDDWEAPSATNDVRIGGRFSTIMAAKDKSTSFDFNGTYTAVEELKLIEYDMDDGRHVKIEFTQMPEGVQIIETFDPESENSEELQRAGWQAILDNFRKHVEGL